jgi:2-phospho-L-lactate guanylyltransferase (CobY/MobA/RfbA family)
MASVSGILMVTVVPSPLHRLQIDGAADLVDVGAHHVHADAAAGYEVTAAAVEKPGAKMNL